MTLPTDRYKKYRASAPVGEIARETVSLSHSAFAATYHFTTYPSAFTGIVQGSAVTFQPYPFEIDLPEASASGRQDMTIKLFMSGAEFAAQLQAAAAVPTEPIMAEFNAYLPLDTASQIAPITLAINEITIDQSNATCRASRPDTLNRAFPGLQYRAEQFPGLVR